MRARRGYLRVGAISGVPIDLHWSLPLGPFVLSGFSLVPAFYFSIFALILVHELGHAAVAKIRGCAVQKIEMHGLGGLCYAQGRTSLDGIAIAWGGVLAQAWLYLVTAFVVTFSPPESLSMHHLVHAFTVSNLWVAALNLMPIAPLDGADAWKLFSALGWFSRSAKIAPLTSADAAAPRPAPAGLADDDPLAEVATTIEEALALAKREARAKRDSVE